MSIANIEPIEQIDLRDVATKSDFRQLEAVLQNNMTENKLELFKYVSDTKLELIKYTHNAMWKTVSLLSVMFGVLLSAFGLIQYFLKLFT